MRAAALHPAPACRPRRAEQVLSTALDNDVTSVSSASGASTPTIRFPRHPAAPAGRAIGISEARFGTVSVADDIEAIPSVSCACGRSSMVEPQPSKLMVRVRFPSPALWSTRILRDVAQLGSASALGAEGRRFKSCHPDSWSATCLVRPFFCLRPTGAVQVAPPATRWQATTVGCSCMVDRRPRGSAEEM